MRRWVVRAALRSPRAVIGVALVLVVVGVSQLRHAKVDALPEFSPPTVEVQTEALGLSAAEVEQYITVPLEQNFLNGIPFLTTIRSASVSGLSDVQLIFQGGANLLTARQLVQERLSLTTELPNVSKPPQMLQAVSSTGRVLMVSLSSTKLSPVELSVLARWTVRPRLLVVSGIANVTIWGQEDQELAVQVNPQQLLARGVSLDQVITTAGNALFVSPLSFLEASTPGSGGFVDTANQRLGVQHILPIKTPDDLAQVAVSETSPVLRLGDVATVVQDHPPVIGDAVLKDGPGLLLVIEKLPGANTTDVTHQVDSALASLRPALAGVTVDASIYRPATFVDTAVDNLTGAAKIAVLLVLLAIVILLGWRAALVAGGTAVTVLVSAAYLLYLRGQTMNAMVFAGLLLAVAVVVHVAVMVSVGATRRRVEPTGSSLNGSDRVAVSARTADALVHAGRPLSWAAAVILLALVPALFLEGMPSSPFVPPMAFAFGLAVVLCLVAATTVAPALAAAVSPAGRRDVTNLLRLRARLQARPGAWSGRLSRRGGEPEGQMAPEPRRRVRRQRGRRLGRTYELVVGRLVRRPVLAGLVAVALLVVGVASATQLTSSLRPSFQETSAVIQWSGPPGTSLDEMSRVIGRAAAELRTLKGVRDVGAHVGRALSADQVVGASSGELWLDLDPKANHDATLAAVTNIVNGYPGFDRRVFSYFDDRVKQVERIPPEPVVVRLYGEDFDVLRSKAEEIRKLLLGVRGVVAPRVEQQPTEPAIDVQVNLDAAQRNGIKPGDIRRAATTLVAGIEVGSLYQDQKVFRVVVRGTPDISRNLTTLQDLVIDTPNGGHVRLGDVAQVSIAPGLSVIKHEAVSRSLDVSAGVKGRNVDAVLQEVQRKVRSVSFPLGHDARVLGDFQTRRASERRVAAIALGVLAFVFLLLQAATRSWRLAILAFTLVPLAAAGGAAAAWATGATVSLGSLAGFFAVGAVATVGGLVLLDRLNRLEAEYGQTFGPALVVRAARECSSPILAAALVTAVALVPFVALGNVPGTELARPMGFVVLGGLVSAMITTLVVVPALYLPFLGGKRTPTEPGAGAGADGRRASQRSADNVVEVPVEVPDAMP